VIDIDKLASQVNRLQHQMEQAAEIVRRETVAVSVAKQMVASVEEARGITQAIAEEMQKRAHDKIASVVTRCLEAVFDDPYEFRIRFEQKRNKTEAVLEFVRDGEVLADPLNEVGGGVLDVAALALRLSCLRVSKPKRRHALILDEPFSFIRGKENQERTAKLLGALADELGVQVVLNTDIPTYKLGTIVDMGGE
jgi:hypothetical protein